MIKDDNHRQKDTKTLGHTDTQAHRHKDTQMQMQTQTQTGAEAETRSIGTGRQWFPPILESQSSHSFGGSNLQEGDSITHSVDPFRTAGG